jgi:Ca2+-binding RTX toxin-like protein
MLAGGGGNDLLEGGPGADGLDGGSVVTGGSGRDTFVLRYGDAAGDRINDFQSGGTEGDVLRLEGYGPGASLVQEGSIWEVLTTQGPVDGFELSGITQLAPADVLFV